MKLSLSQQCRQAPFAGVLGVGVLALLLGACQPVTGPTGPTGPSGPTGPTGPAGPGVGDNPIGNGSGLTAEQIDQLGRLVAHITAVQVSSPPVVTFDVEDQNGDPAMGLSASAIRFTMAKLIPALMANNQISLPSHWQSYINTTKSLCPFDYVNHVQPTSCVSMNTAVQATNETGGTLVELSPGHYRYTFANDVTNITTPIPVAWDPTVTNRVGMEIRLSGAAEELAPLNPVYDFVPQTGQNVTDTTQPGVIRDVVATDNCVVCHKALAFHGGPRNATKYCVTCHNPGSVDPATGNPIDFRYMIHSIHMGGDRPGADPFTIIGYGNSVNDYSDVTFPQSKTYCETCHSDAAGQTAARTDGNGHPVTNASPPKPTVDGDLWNTSASAEACGGCHANGLTIFSTDAVTGQHVYRFDHTAAGFPIGVFSDDQCYICHVPAAPASSGPALFVHSHIAGDARFRNELGKDFVFKILSATNTSDSPLAADGIPRIHFRIDHANGTAWNIFSDAPFQDGNTRVYLRVGWATTDIYNGDELGNTGGKTYNGTTISDNPVGEPYTVDINGLKADATHPVDGSYWIDFPAGLALPHDIHGDPMVAMDGRLVVSTTDFLLNSISERAYPISAIYYPGMARATAFTPPQCNNCHKVIQLHGGNRNGNTEVCVICHNADLSILDSPPDTDAGSNGYSFGYFIHAIHSASATLYNGTFSDVTFPQDVDNCDTCHKPGAYNVARSTARAVSTNPGADGTTWMDDTATTVNAAVCGVCHTTSAAQGHFLSNGGQIDTGKGSLVVGSPPAPTGLEGCAVCHGAGREFDTVKYHNK